MNGHVGGGDDDDATPLMTCLTCGGSVHPVEAVEYGEIKNGSLENKRGSVQYMCDNCGRIFEKESR